MPLKEEMCAYLHMLPCLGKRNKEKWNKTNHPKTDPDYFTDMFRILKNSTMKIIVMNESTFTHFGTMREYIENFCYNPTFAFQIGIDCFVNNSFPWKFLDQKGKCRSETIVSMSSKYGKNASLSTLSGNHVLIEWCNVDCPIRIEDDVIISNCTIANTDQVSFCSEAVTIFGNCLYTTVPLRDPSSDAFFYVTFAVNLDANIKYSSVDLSSVKYFNISLAEVFRILGLPLPTAKELSLWTAKIFPAANTAAHSFWLTHNLVNFLLNKSKLFEMQTDLKVYNGDRFSMSDIITKKDLNCLIDGQTALKQ